MVCGPAPAGAAASTAGAGITTACSAVCPAFNAHATSGTTSSAWTSHHGEKLRVRAICFLRTLSRARPARYSPIVSTARRRARANHNWRDAAPWHAHDFVSATAYQAANESSHEGRISRQLRRVATGHGHAAIVIDSTVMALVPIDAKQGRRRRADAGRDEAPPRPPRRHRLAKGSGNSGLSIFRQGYSLLPCGRGPGNERNTSILNIGGERREKHRRGTRRRY